LGSAEVEMEFQPMEWDWSWVITEPVAEQDSLHWLRERSEHEAGLVRAKFERLCQRAKDAPTFTRCRS
jgi:hypothetical protein